MKNFNKRLITLVLVGFAFQASASNTASGSRKKASTVAAAGLGGIAAGFLLMNLQPKPQENTGLIWAGALLGTLGGAVYVSMPENQQATNMKKGPDIVFPIAFLEF